MTLTPGFLARIVCRVDGCHEWTGGKTTNGYGRYNHGPHRLAHRIAYEHARGPIPPGLVIDHLCLNRACVNPDHMEPVTIRENTLRGNAPTAQLYRKQICNAGHELTWRNGERRCWRCRLDRSNVVRRAARASRKASRSAATSDEPAPEPE